MNCAFRAFALAVVFLVSGPASAQPEPDPLGLRQEFGAFDITKAAEMIRQCEMQTASLEVELDSFRRAQNEYERERQAYDQAATRAQEAWRAAEDALSHYTTLGGTEREGYAGPQTQRFLLEVLEPRRTRYAKAKADAEAQQLRMRQAESRWGARGIVLSGVLTRIGSPHPGVWGMTDAQLMHRQTERCRRMRLWAQFGGARREDEPIP